MSDQVVVSRAAVADCLTLTDLTQEWLDKQRTYTLDQMLIAAESEEKRQKAAPWLSLMLREYLRHVRHVDV